MSFYVSPLSKEDIDAVNNWHWPLTYQGCLDIFAPVECNTEEMIAFRTKRLTDRFRHAYNTYKKYRLNGESSGKPAYEWPSHTQWLLEVIAKIAVIDKSVIPEDLHKMIPYCQQWLNAKDDEERWKLRDKCYCMIDIFIEGQPVIKRGRPPVKRMST